MADVLNRTTNQFLTSVNTPDFPTADWIINPDLSAVTGFASKYWIITGDVVTLLDQAARDAVDAAELAQKILDDKTFEKLRYDLELAIKALALITKDEINILRDAMTTLSTEANAVAGSITVHNLPDRTNTQLKNAFENQVDSI